MLHKDGSMQRWVVRRSRWRSLLSQQQNCEDYEEDEDECEQDSHPSCPDGIASDHSMVRPKAKRKVALNARIGCFPMQNPVSRLARLPERRLLPGFTGRCSIPSLSTFKARVRHGSPCQRLQCWRLTRPLLVVKTQTLRAPTTSAASGSERRARVRPGSKHRSCRKFAVVTSSPYSL